MSTEGLNAIQVAELLKITKNTVYELVKRGELPGYKVGKKLRIDKSDVLEYINKQKGNNRVKANVAKVEVAKAIKETRNGNEDFIIAGQDIILDILSDFMKEKVNDIRILRSNIGSYTNLYDLYNNNISVCSAHLWDSDNNEYNTPYVRRLLPGVPCVLINIAYRMQGFYVAKGNPHNIRNWTDLIKEDICIINREKGSGTRILLDEKLRANNITPKEINGYYFEKNSHLSVASSVARGEGHVGMGTEKVALQVSGIDFVPMQEERYDLVIKKEDLDLPLYNYIVEIINSQEFRDQLEGLGGYDLRDTGKIVGVT